MYRYVKSGTQVSQNNLRTNMKDIQDDVLNATSDYLKNEFGWDLNDIADMFFIDVDTTSDNRIKVEIRAELDYDDMIGLCNSLNDVLEPYDENAYFDMVDSGIAEAYVNLMEDDFDERYDEKFGEPTTEVFTVSEFNQWMNDVIDFE